MINILRHRFIFYFISILIAALSSLSILVIDSWIKYPLIVFEIITILFLWILITHRDHRLSSPLKGMHISYSSIAPELILLAFSGILILMELYDQSENGNLFQLIMGVISSSVLVGLCFFNIFNLNQAFNNLEKLLLSFAISIIFSALVSLIILYLSASSKPIAILVIFGAIAICSLLVRAKRKGIRNTELQDNRSLSRDIDVIGIVLCECFVIFMILVIYPNAAFIYGTDIHRHYGNTLVLLTTPTVYHGFQYIFFNLYQAAIVSLTGLNQDIGLLQTSLVFLNTLFPLSIYAMARRYLSNFDNRIPIVATILCTMFSNLSFIYYLEQKLTGNHTAEISLIQAAAEKTFLGTVNLIQPMAFLTPQSISVTFLLISLMMLTRLSLSQTKFVSMVTLLIVGMYLIHVTEAIIFIIIVCICSFIVSENRLRLSDALLSSLFSIVIVSGFLVYEEYGWRSEISHTIFTAPASLAIISTLLVIVVTIFWRYFLSKKLVPTMRKIGFFFRVIVSKESINRILTLALLLVYFVGLFTWQYSENFRASSVIYSGIAPWFIYPLLLGVIGLLAILSIRFLRHFRGDSRPTLYAGNSAVIILCFIIILFLFGRLVSLVNTNYIHTGYWEKRFIGYIFLMVAMVAPIPLIGFYETIRRKLNEGFSNVLVVLLISVVTILGFSSFAVQTEYWSLLGNADSNIISENELSAITFLKNRIADQKDSLVVTPNKYSGEVLSIAGVKHRFTGFDLLSSSKDPAVPIQAISTLNSSHVYLYVHERDQNTLVGNPDNWLLSHLVPTLQPIYSNEEVTIYELPRMSYPQAYSDTVLLTPANERNKRWLYAYDIAAFTGGNYTVRNDRDPYLYDAKTKVLSYDPNAKYTLTDFFSTQSVKDFEGYTKLSGNWTLQKDGLHASLDSADPLAINMMMLSPLRHLQGDDINISSTVFIEETESDSINYIRLIYSWENFTNYRYVEVPFMNGLLYVNSGVVTDGKVQATSNWPGIQVKPRWKDGDNLDFSMSISNNTLRVGLNGTNIVYLDLPELEPGSIGFGSVRGKDIIFKELSINVNGTKTDVSRFMDFVKNGGSLVVINTDGRGSFYEIVKTSHDLKRNANNNLNDTKSTIAVYGKKIGNGQISYLDVFQTISNIEGGDQNLMSLYNASKHITSDRISAHKLENVKAIFDGVWANGNISIFANSVAPIDMVSSLVIEFENKSRIGINNINDLYIEHPNQAEIQTNKMMIMDGRGFYTNMMITPDGPAMISFDGNANISLKVDKTVVNLQDVSIISFLTSEPISVLDPSFVLKGNATFKKVSSGQLREETGIEGQDLIVQGKSSFDVLMADSNIMAENIEMTGRKEVNPPVQSFDELRPIDSPLSMSRIYSAPQIVRVLLVLPVIVAIVLMMVPLSKEISYWKPEDIFDIDRR